MLSCQGKEEPGISYTNLYEFLRAACVGHYFSGSSGLTGRDQSEFWSPEKTLRQIHVGVGSQGQGRDALKW